MKNYTNRSPTVIQISYHIELTSTEDLIKLLLYRLDQSTSAMTSPGIYRDNQAPMVSLTFLQQSIANSIFSAALRTLPSILDLPLEDLGYTGSSNSHDLSFNTELASQLAIALEPSLDPKMSLRDVVKTLSTTLLAQADQQSPSGSVSTDQMVRLKHEDDILNTQISLLSLTNEWSSLPGPLCPPDTRHLLLAGSHGSSLLCALLERLTRRPFPSELETITVIVRGASTEGAYATLVGSLGSKRYNVPTIMGGVDQVDVQVIGWDGSNAEGLEIKDIKRLEGGVDTTIVCGPEDPKEDLTELTLCLLKLGIARRRKNFYLISPRRGLCDFFESPGLAPRSPNSIFGHHGTTPNFRDEPLTESIVRTISSNHPLSSTIIPLPPLLPHFQHGTWSRSSVLGNILRAGLEVRSLPEIPLKIRIPWITMDRAAGSIVDRIFFAPQEKADASTPNPEISLTEYIRWGDLLNELKRSMYFPFDIVSKKDWTDRLNSISTFYEDAGAWIGELEGWTEGWDKPEDHEEKGERKITNLIDHWVRDWTDTIND